jgi:N-acetylglutamate synthase-like GNAT family acetyltransferase
VEIEYLADNKEVIPTLARWSYDEWLYLHPERTLSDVERIMLERSNKDKIPLILIACEEGKPIGMVALKIRDLESRPNIGPWLAGLYVEKGHRNKGVGTSLVRAIEQKAAQLKEKKLYLFTPDTEKFFLMLDWAVQERTEWKGRSVTVMEKEIVL